ncbi:MAG: AAA family ATPase [Gemmatimonadota bacterium]|nr:AAA family ATPase [Gemmatimonadota bacterium]MDE2870087.1 AAA family ATPase [Gemmatimonadota bacterium]
MRDFNTAGPVRPEDHYCVPPLDRLDLDDVLSLVRGKRYFVMHAPRQTGKTSALLALRDLLNSGDEGEYRCAYINVESAQTAREDVGQAMGAIASQIGREARYTLGDEATAQTADRLDTTSRPHAALGTLLEAWARAASPPLVLLIDEIDAMVGDSLVSALRQLRTGYVLRPAGFPQSVVLCGVRDVRDYRIRASSEKEVITGGSAFNIKAKSLRLGDFSRSQVADLLGQHTAATGQAFAPEAVDAVWDQTRGQPWLVNALAQEMCFSSGAVRERSRAIAESDVFEAREELILRRETHLDQLTDKLREPRVRRVIEPLLSGGDGTYSDLDFEYVRDLGLVAPGAPLRIANPIYGEVLPRVLTWVLEHDVPEPPPAWYVDTAGDLDLDKLLAAFQDFFRQNSEHWIERARYTEAGPQLVLQAFLHRVVNGRGRIGREYALGSRRVDLLIIWPDGTGGEKRFVIECKLVKEGRSVERATEQGLEQTAAYMDISGATSGHLIVFDMREGRSWADRVYREPRDWRGTPVTVWGA